MIPRSARTVSLLKFGVSLLFLIIVIAVMLPAVTQGRLIWPKLSRCHWEWLVVAVLAQVGVYYSLAGIIGVALRSMDHRVPGRTLFFMALAFLFTTRAFAMFGLATLVLVFKRRGISADRAQATAGTFYLADYAAFILLGLAVVAVTMVTAPHGGSAGVPMKTLLQSVAFLVTGVGLTVWGLWSPDGVTRFSAKAARAAALLVRHREPAVVEERVRTSVTAFYSRWDDVTRRRHILLTATAWAFLMHVCESASVYASTRAFEADPGVSAPAAAYVAGNLAALVSFLPGGVGFYETAMAAALHHYGNVPTGSAILGTLAYRAVSLWLPLPIVLGVVREVMAKEKEAHRPNA